MSLSADHVEFMLETAVAEIEVPGLSLAVFDEGTMIQCATGRAQLDPERRVRPEDLFPIWSVTKIMTATMVLILADRDLLDLRATIASAIPGIRIAGDAADRITIRQLLSHTAGMPPMTPPPSAIADKGAGDDCRELFVNNLASVRLIAQPGRGVLLFELGLCRARILDRAIDQNYVGGGALRALARPCWNRGDRGPLLPSARCSHGRPLPTRRCWAARQSRGDLPDVALVRTVFLDALGHRASARESRTHLLQRRCAQRPPDTQRGGSRRNVRARIRSTIGAGPCGIVSRPGLARLR